MTPTETQTAAAVTNPIGFYHIVQALDENELAWFHVVEWLAEKSIFVSIYRAASLEDAQDVLGIYANE